MPRIPRGPNLRTARLVHPVAWLGLGLALNLTGPAAAQAPASDRAGFCWRGHPDCTGFMLFEVEVGVDPFHGFTPQLEFGLGVMKNVSHEWGVGARVSLLLGAVDGLGLSVRGRRWLNDDFSVEAEAGGLRSQSRWAGPTTGARFNWRDYGSVFLRHDLVPAGDSEPSRRLMLGGVSAGSTPAAIADGLLLILFAILLPSNPSMAI